VPWPGILVEKVIALKAPASATIHASWFSRRALSTLLGIPAALRSAVRLSDTATLVVPNRMGRPARCTCLISASRANRWSSPVGKM